MKNSLASYLLGLAGFTCVILATAGTAHAQHPVELRVSVEAEPSGTFLYSYELKVIADGFPSGIAWMVFADTPPGEIRALESPSLVGPAPGPWTSLVSSTGEHNGPVFHPVQFTEWNPTGIGDSLNWQIRANNANCNMQWSNIKGPAPQANFEQVVQNQDLDGDGICDIVDNCILDVNADQADSDGDGVGDSCDDVNNADIDGDGVDNGDDNCPVDANADQADADSDGTGDVCDDADNNDVDGDGVDNGDDNCPVDANADQADEDSDGFGDVCDSTDGDDVDADGVDNGDDNCPLDANADQADSDGDGFGDVCDSVDNSGSGGCSTSSGASPLALLLIALVALRRRREEA